MNTENSSRESIDGKRIRPKFTVIELSDEERAAEEERTLPPVVDVEKVEELCRLDLVEDDRFSRKLLALITQKNEAPTAELKKSANDKLWYLFDSLLTRPYESELPTTARARESFVFKRNITICRELRSSVSRLSKGQYKSSDESALEKDLEQVGKLLQIEEPKISWLEEVYYPELFSSAVKQAQGDVMQFLLVERNTQAVDRDELFSENNLLVKFQDDINYTLDNANLRPDTMGHCVSLGEKYAKVTIRIPPYYSARDEGKVYVVAVHEFIHAVSTRSRIGRIGIENGEKSTDESYQEMNEAITEIVAYAIATEHFAQGKKSLRGVERSKVNLEQSGYFDYISLTSKYFAQVPLSYFIRAMLSEDGFSILEEKFIEEFGSTEPLKALGKKLRDLYKPPVQEVKPEETGQIISMSEKRAKFRPSSEPEQHISHEVEMTD